MKKTIKVVQIISSLSIGGAQVLLFDIMKFLAQKENLEISVITIDSGEYIKMFQDAGIKVMDIEEKGLFNVRIFFKIKKLLEELKPDIVHTHLNKADFYGRIAAKYVNVPIIVSTCHNYSTTHKNADVKKKSFFDFVDNLVIWYSKSYLIAISELVKQYLINRNPKFEKVTEVIYNGVNIEKEKYLLNKEQQSVLRKKYNLDKSDFVISIAGRLEKQKGHFLFLESVKDFLKNNDKVKVLIIGDGSLKNEITNFIVSNSLENKVQILGFIKDVEPLIEISDLICVPSLWEGFGLIIIEGMIKKKLVLASNVGGIPEIIEDGKTGFLFQSQNKESLIEKLNNIYEHFNELDFIRTNALSSVKEKFDIEKNSELYFQFYLKKLNIIKNRNYN